MQNWIHINQLPQEQPKWFESTQDFDTLIMDYSEDVPKKIKIQIQITKEKEIIYTRNGQLLRIDQVKDTSEIPELWTNLDQIHHINWSGVYGKDNQKIGRWTMVWKGETLNTVGGQYSNNRQKQGLWKEINKNFWSKAQVYEIGEYSKGVRIGIWKYIHQNKEIGGGKYNQKGQQNGQWIELSERFHECQQVTFNGQYNNGKKVGRWDICLIQKGLFGLNFKKMYLQISTDLTLRGGGSYSEGNSEKIGSWIELRDQFKDSDQLTQAGEYLNGRKVGRWDNFRKINKEFELIDCIVYDQLGEVIFSKNFQNILYKGKLSQGRKVGKWKFLYNINQDGYKQKAEMQNIIYKELQQFVFLSGGGLYDEAGVKQGNWVELSELFNPLTFVKYQGDYYNNKKVGRWDIFEQESMMQNIIYKVQQLFVVLSGGGSYDGIGQKQGIWVELDSSFHNLSYIKYQGQYKNNKKVGKWEIFKLESIMQNIIYKVQQIFIVSSGGGLYDELGLKQGKWVEQFYQFGQLLIGSNEGEYKNNKKIGIWSQILGNMKVQEIKYDDLQNYQN